MKTLNHILWTILVLAFVAVVVYAFTLPGYFITDPIVMTSMSIDWFQVLTLLSALGFIGLSAPFTKR